jgi:conjugative relaxase-like TrwC/TraI family protein
MMSIGFVTAQGGRYYTDLVRSTDYYTSGGESPATWHLNEAAVASGFHGTVEKQDIERLFDGYHPKTGEPLAQNHGKDNRRAAIDICLSVPKDVSALWAVSGEEDRRQIEKAFEKAVAETLEYTSDHFGYTRRGQGGYEREKVDLLIAKFIHRQSRGQDPQLHAHCLAINTAMRADLSFGTIDAGPLLGAKRMLGAYFRSALANELGISLAPDEKTKFSFRVPGVPEALSEHWSSRAQEIKEAARARGVEGAKNKAYLALETRKAKDERPLCEVKEEWRETARRHGFTERHVEEILRQRRPALTPEQTATIIDAAVENAVKHLTSQQAHFTKNDLLRDVYVRTVAAGIAPRQIHERVEQTLRQERFIDLGQGQRFTTKEIFHEVEQKALETAARLGEQRTRPVSERRVEKAIAAESRLNDGQKAAVRLICQGPDLTLLQGPPGSGKSTLFSVVRKSIEKDGGNVIGLTPSNRAARELEKSSGIKSYTIDRFLHDRERTVADTAKHHATMVIRTALGLPTWKPPKLDINRRTTLIIDECAMVDNDKLARALQHAEKAGCRVVLAGDPRQLAAIAQGGLFREMYERARDEQKTALTEIVRQREVWAREAIHQVGRGDAAEALMSYAVRGRLHLAPTRDEAEHRLIERWKEHAIANPQGNLILASTNAEVDRLNQRAQEVVREAGRLGFRSVRVGEQVIHEGDRILFTDTNKKLGLVKSEFATVTRIEWHTQKLTVRIDGQDNPVTFSLRKFDSLRLGYAATTHRAQGMTLEQDAYVLVGGSMQNREMTYVQISRAKGETHLFTDEKSAGQAQAELLRAISRSEEKLSAHTVAREAEQREQQQRQEQSHTLSL